MRIGSLVFITAVSGTASKSKSSKSLSKQVEAPLLLDLHLPKPVLPSDGETVLVKKEYTSALNLRTHMPDWVAEKLTPTNFSGKGVRTQSRWIEDPQLKQLFPWYKPVFFESSKNVRSHGHLAAACLHHSSQTAMDQTFLKPSNAVPQEYSMNGCDWHRLERLTRSLFDEFANPEVFVLSGPLFLPNDYNTDLTDPANAHIRRKLKLVYLHDKIPVPTHLFKVILVRSLGIEAASAFIVPNRSILDEKPLQEYQVALSKLESLSGLDLAAYVANEDLCDLGLCADTQQTWYMDFIRLQARVRAVKTLSELRDVVKDAIDQHCFGKHQLALVQLVYARLRDPKFIGKTLTSVQTMVDFLFPPVTDQFAPDRYRYRRLMFFGLTMLLASPPSP